MHRLNTLLWDEMNEYVMSQKIESVSYPEGKYMRGKM